MSTKKPLTHLLIKPSGSRCNLNCDYCFYLDKAKLYPGKSNTYMDEETLEALIRNSLSDAYRFISFAWQGGEPTLLGLDFLKKVVELQMKYGKDITIGNSLQTNGVLINSDYASFLNQYHWLVGISLDGPEQIHNKYRLDKRGNGTWKQVQDNAKMLIHSEVATNAMSCVTSYSAKYPDLLYSYFKDLGFDYAQFIPILELDIKTNEPAQFSVSPRDYGKFMCRIFDLWFSDYTGGRKFLNIRFIDEFFRTFVNIESAECIHQPECGKYLVVEHNGDVYSCDYFVHHYTKLGNVKDDSLLSLLNSDNQIKFGKKKRNISKDCKSCRWLNHCNGDCPKYRKLNPAQDGKSWFCESYKIFLDYTSERFQYLAQNFQANKGQHGLTYDASFDF